MKLKSDNQYQKIKNVPRKLTKDECINLLGISDEFKNDNIDFEEILSSK